METQQPPLYTCFQRKRLYCCLEACVAVLEETCLVVRVMSDKSHSATSCMNGEDISQLKKNDSRLKIIQMDGHQINLYRFSCLLDKEKRRFSEVHCTAQPGYPAAALRREGSALPLRLQPAHQEIEQSQKTSYRASDCSKRHDIYQP